jgi:hypothetical protein
VLYLGVMLIVPDCDMTVAATCLVSHGHSVGFVGRGASRG